VLPSPRIPHLHNILEKEEIIKKRKIKYIIGLIWWQFRKKRVKQRLFEGIKASKELKSTYQ